ncbi:HAMP domain-containing protein [Bradyrhizobium diazoefficiens]|nr:HAMP domain-containing protein [Bradyrhizobium diazoefficiens]UCF55593.1 MAG: HAMP domain-containing protein [Bradyrhizobium sp.]MBR0981972.1 HAMP domain-containing protein [Bradyrhizobium diazoefficiens]MBR1011479.1 HAMP domain-containing protein [Bradyrhizobium diazoefficiens]MBR1017836.1 HAMP domain-containing protein [Bradyrhizobium diazoefficiens]
MKLNRIGYKLGLVGLLGVALAGGQMINQMISEQTVDSAMKRAQVQQTISATAIETRAAIRRMQLGVRDVRLAKSAQDAEKASGVVVEAYQSANKFLDSAIARVTRPENRERFEKVKSLVSAYSDGASDIKRDQLKIFEITAGRNKTAADWRNSFTAMIALPAVTSAANRIEIEKIMYETDAHFNALRAATWRFSVTEEESQLAAIKQRATDLAEALARLKAVAGDKSLAPLVDKMAADATTFSALTNESLKAETAKKDDVAKALATANEAVELANTASQVGQKLAEEAATTASAELSQANRVGFIASVLVMLAMTGSVVFAFLGVARPLTALNGALGRIAAGELNVQIPGASRGDEVGDIAKTVVVISANAEQKAREEAEAQARQEQSAAQQRKADMVRLADGFEAAVGEIVETVASAATELEASASTLTSAAARSQDVTVMVASASEEASTNVQSVASATEELSSSVNEISRQVQASARMANEAVDQARITNDRVSELSKAAARIGDVVELINTIAGQTNLLALNATIEAARAGEAGRGFAVVASEVKALAEQTAKATGEIGQQITGIQAATQESVGAIREISGTIERLSEISATIAAAVEEQGAATQEIARNVQQAAQGTQQVSTNITEVQRSATETGSASSQVLSAAQMLSGDSNRLKSEVSRFLDTVRAA